MRASVLIDTDTGIDDAVAIALAPHLARLDVVALTSVHGNADTARATRNAREVARRAGLSVSVAAGATRPLVRPPHPARETHGPEGLGYVTPSTRAQAEPDRGAETIIDAAERHRGLQLCCLGPLTNLARAIMLEPDLRQYLGPVFIMGGSVGVRGTMTRWSEFNWWSDPEAVEVVLHAELDIRLVPLDVTRRIAIPGSAIRALGEAGRGDDDARFWADALRFYADFHRSHEQLDGAIVNDALCIALVDDPTLATWHEMRIGVSLGDDDRRGAILVDEATGARALVAMDVRAHDVLSLIGKSIFARWLPPSERLLQSGAPAADAWLRANPLGEARL